MTRVRFDNYVKEFFSIKIPSLFFFSIQSFLSFFLINFYSSIFDWFRIDINNLFWFVFDDIIIASNKHPCIWLIFNFMSVYFLSYHWVKNKLIFFIKLSGVHDPYHGFCKLNYEARADLTFFCFNIKKNYLEVFFKPNHFFNHFLNYFLTFQVD
jgi:hypothetical protein